MADEPTGPFRVKDPKTGHEYTTAVLFEGLDDVTSPENPALDESGNHRPPVYATTPPELADRTIDELKDYAAQGAIDLGGATKKADIVAAIKAKEASL